MYIDMLIIAIYLYLTLFSIVVAYLIGATNTIKEDIKSLNYDNLEEKYIELKKSIQIIEETKE